MRRQQTAAQVQRVATGNELAARIILADPVRYAGLMVIWARMWMSRHLEKQL